LFEIRVTVQKNSLKKVFNGVSIRPVRMRDLDAVFDLQEKVLTEDYEATVEQKKQWLHDWFKLSLQSPSTNFLVAVNDNREPVGMVLGHKYENGVGLIGDLGVAEEYRGRGLGRALLERVSESLKRKGADCLVLEVFDDNKPAIHLYETAGFVKTSRRHVLKGSRRKGFQMAKWFTP
jgi:ribosomal protein S18 acetylase RimI-like enzyme